VAPTRRTTPRLSALRRRPRPGSPLRGPALRLLLASSVLVFAGFTLLLPVVPVFVVEVGGGPVAAGAATGVFMSTTVLTQLTVPALLRRRGHRVVLLAGAALLGAPALGYPLLATPSGVLLLSGARGAGFGLVTVAGAALVAELVPAETLGAASGAYGVAVGAPQLLTLLAGLTLQDAVGSTPVLLLGAALPLLGGLLALGLPGHTGPEARPSTALPAQLVAAPALGMLVVALAFGAAVTFLPLALPERTGAVGLALGLLTAAALAGRAVAGVLVDRSGAPGRLLPGGVLLVATGAAVLAFAVGTGQALLLLSGAGLLGTGFGVVQNDSLVQLFATAGPQRYGAASAVWNVAYDGGTGLGAVILGVLVTAAGYTRSFGITAGGIAAVGLVLLVAARRRDPQSSSR